MSPTQTKVIQVEKRLQCIKTTSDSLREEQDSLSEEIVKLKEQVKVVSRAHKEQEVVDGKTNKLSMCQCFMFTSEIIIFFGNRDIIFSHSLFIFRL